MSLHSSMTTWVTAWDNVFSGSYVVFAGNKRHLQPLDAFSELLMRPKCICGQGAYSAHLYLLAGGEGARCPSFAAPSSNSFTALGLRPRSSALLASGVHHPRQMDGFVAGCGIARFPCDSTVLVVVVVVVVVFGFITNKQSWASYDNCWVLKCWLYSRWTLNQWRQCKFWWHLLTDKFYEKTECQSSHL